jgi:hypothetical protein
LPSTFLTRLGREQDNNMTLKEHLTERFGDLDKLEPNKKSQLFLDIYQELITAMKRDFLADTSLQVREIELIPPKDNETICK